MKYLASLFVVLFSGSVFAAGQSAQSQETSQLFKHLDTNSDQVISQQEVEQFQEQLMSQWSELDQNQNDQLEQAEFARFEEMQQQEQQRQQQQQQQQEPSR